MNNTINLPQLIALLARATDTTPAAARRFIHDFFAQIEARLLEGETIEIKGIGQFVASGDKTQPVLFRPDEKLAQAINEPFAMFEAVELADGVEFDQTETEEPETPENLEIPEEPELPAPPVEPVLPAPPVEPEMPAPPVEPELPAPPVEPEVPSPAEATIADPEIAAEANIMPEPEPEPESEPEPQPEPMPDAPSQPRDHRLWLALGLLIGLILGLVIGFFVGKDLGRYVFPSEEDEEYLSPDSMPYSAEETAPFAAALQDTVATAPAVAQTTPQTVDTAKPAPAAQKPAATPATPAAKEPVYDYITDKMFLSALSHKHYGVRNYWIFIYEANLGLGNPNRIKPGTRLLIPDKASFAEATKAQTDAKAQKKLNELSKKYRL